MRNFTECRAHFSELFLPAPDAFGYQFVTLVLFAVDDQGAESERIAVPIAVLPVNDPPTIVGPAVVQFVPGEVKSKLSNGEERIQLADIDASTALESLSISVLTGDGKVLLPDTAKPRCQPEQSGGWACMDRISSFNSWLPEMQFEFTDSAKRAGPSYSTIFLIVDDLGNTGYNNLPHLNATLTVRVEYSPPATVVAPDTNPALTAGVAAAVALGLLLLAGAGWLLKNKLGSPPTSAYFAQGALSNAQANPLYASPNIEGTNPLYR